MERCIRCDGELENGFILDKGDGGSTSQALWASGDPNTSFRQMSAVKPGNKTLPVITYRCKSCGRLESFAYTAA
jgi:hypothetical protein